MRALCQIGHLLHEIESLVGRPQDVVRLCKQKERRNDSQGVRGNAMIARWLASVLTVQVPFEGRSASLETSNRFELSSVDFGATPIGGARRNSVLMGLEHAAQCARGIVL